jgi:hypothetical protein
VSFKTISYRIVRPTLELTEIVSRHKQQYDEDLFGIFLYPEIWSFPDNSHHTRTELSIYKLKLMFLADFYTDNLKHYTHGKPSGNLIEQLFGEPPFNVEVFDRWWWLEKVSGVEKFEEYEGRAKATPEFSSLIARTGYDSIDRWIDELSAK